MDVDVVHLKAAHGGTLLDELRGRVRMASAAASDAAHDAVIDGQAPLAGGTARDAALVRYLLALAAAEEHGHTPAGLQALLALGGAQGPERTGDRCGSLDEECIFVQSMPAGCRAQVRRFPFPVDRPRPPATSSMSMPHLSACRKLTFVLHPPARAWQRYYARANRRLPR